MTHRCSEDTKEGDKFAGDEGALLRLCRLVETFPVRRFCNLSVIWQESHLLVAL